MVCSRLDFYLYSFNLVVIILSLVHSSSIQPSHVKLSCVQGHTSMESFLFPQEIFPGVALFSTDAAVHAGIHTNSFQSSDKEA